MSITEVEHSQAMVQVSNRLVLQNISSILRTSQVTLELCGGGVGNIFEDSFLEIRNLER